MARGSETPTYKRAGEWTNADLSPSLDEIDGTEILLQGFTAEDRIYRGNSSVLVNVTVSDVDGENVRDYHAWSPPLAERLRRIPAGQFPVLATFYKQTGQRGRFWSVE